MTKILVTGANGFLGSNLVRKLIKSSENDIHVFIHGKTNLWRIKDMLYNLHVHILDIADNATVMKKMNKIRPEIIYHCAAYGVYSNQKDLNKIIQTNIFGSINLMQASVKNKRLKRFVNIGSSFEYVPTATKLKETDITSPLTPYGISKASQTFFAKYFTTKYDLPVVTLRIFTPYGSFEEPGRLISDVMIASILKKKLNLSTIESHRDFIYIDDVTDALIKASYVNDVAGEIINIGTGNWYSVEDIILMVKKIAKSSIKISIQSKQRDYDKLIGKGKVCANIKKAERLLKWKPKFTIQQGLASTFLWYQENSRFYK